MYEIIGIMYILGFIICMIIFIYILYDYGCKDFKEN